MTRKEPITVPGICHAGQREPGKSAGPAPRDGQGRLGAGPALSQTLDTHCGALFLPIKADSKRHREQHDGNDEDAHAQVPRLQAMACCRRRVSRNKRCGQHAGVVHAAYSHAHDQGATKHLPFASQIEGKPERHDRGEDGDYHREDDQAAIVGNGGRHQHRRHAQIVHARYPETHERACTDKLGPGKNTQSAQRQADPTGSHRQ